MTSRRMVMHVRGTITTSMLAAAIALCALAVALPATAGAVGTKGFRDGRGTKGFAVSKSAPAGSATQPAIGPAPGKATGKEWFVTNNGHKATILAITKAGRISNVSSDLSASSAGATGDASYGSAVADGYEWLVKYGQSSSPLYAISASGKVKQVDSSVGSDITDLTTGPGGTLDFSSKATGPLTCSITRDPSATCQSSLSLAGLLSSLLGGFRHLDAISADSGKLWFTDNTGELGNFNLLSALGGVVGGLLDDLLGGPFGDTGTGTGEASAKANTITADRNGYLYVAGGQFTSKTGKNNEILKVEPKTGKTVKTYKRGLTDVTALTQGFGTNVWFLDKKSPTAGKVGLLNTKTGKITEYKLPAGFKFGPKIAEISVGPAGSKTLYFTLETKSGAAAIGELTGA